MPPSQRRSGRRAEKAPVLRVALLAAAAFASWLGARAFALGCSAPHLVAHRRAALAGLGASSSPGSGSRILLASFDSRSNGLVALWAAKKAPSKVGEPICDGDTVYIKMWTGRYIGELDGTSRKEWVKARGTKKDKDHALTIEKRAGGEIESGDEVRLVMPLTVTNGTKVHMDIVGSAVRARFYDPRGEWQKMTIIKQEGGVIRDGDTIFIRSVFKNGRDYMDANPLDKPDGVGGFGGEVKCRWPDEGDWQRMTIEK